MSELLENLNTKVTMTFIRFFLILLFAGGVSYCRGYQDAKWMSQMSNEELNKHREGSGE